MPKKPAKRGKPKKTEKSVMNPLFSELKPRVFRKPAGLSKSELLKKANGRAHQLMRVLPKIASKLERAQAERLIKEAKRIAGLYNKGKLTGPNAKEFLNRTQWLIDNYLKRGH